MTCYYIVMNRLEDHINSLNFAHQLPEVCDLLHKSTAGLTRWGKRVIAAEGYVGLVSLETVANKVRAAGAQRNIRFEDTTPNFRPLTSEERLFGVESVNQIKKFYEITDTFIRQSSLLLRILDWFRQFSLSPYTIQFVLEEGWMVNNFLCFDPKKEDLPENPYHKCWSGDRSYLYTTEALLRAHIAEQAHISAEESVQVAEQSAFQSEYADYQKLASKLEL